MTTRADFTDQEWFLVSSTPSLIGAAVAAIGKSGVMGTAKEMMANIKGVTEARDSYPNNELLQSIVGASKTKEQAKQDGQHYQEMAVEKLKANNVNSTGDLVEQMLRDVDDVVALLEERATPDEVADYKTWAMNVGRKVAEAAKEGGFFGFGGEQVSAQEESLLNQVAEKLGQFSF